MGSGFQVADGVHVLFAVPWRMGAYRGVWGAYRGVGCKPWPNLAGLLFVLCSKA